MNFFDRLIDRFIHYIRDDPQTILDKQWWLDGLDKAPTRRLIPVGPGGAHNPTYWRYFVWPRNRFLNCYLHDFRRDDAQDLHDHRMLNITFICSTDGYFEERFSYRPVEGFPLPPTEQIPVRRFRPYVRLPSTPHRVVLHRDADGRPIPVWSLFIGFPQIRNWGFWCPGRGSAKWRPMQDYLGAVGSGEVQYGYHLPIRGCD